MIRKSGSLSRVYVEAEVRRQSRGEKHLVPELRLVESELLHELLHNNEADETIPVDIAFEVLGSAQTVNDAERGQGLTPLIRAVRCNSVPLVLRLLEMGASIDQQDTDVHRSPLIWAIGSEFYPVAALLILRGASLNLRTKYGYTALMVLATKYNPDSESLMDLLMDRDIDLTATSTAGDNALILASKHNNLQFCIKFMEAVDKKHNNDTFAQNFGMTLNALSVIAENNVSLASEFLLSPAMALQRQEDEDVDYAFKFPVLRDQAYLAGDDKPYAEQTHFWSRMFNKELHKRRGTLGQEMMQNVTTLTDESTLYIALKWIHNQLTRLIEGAIDVHARVFQLRMQDMASRQALQLYMCIAHETQDFSLFGAESVRVAVDFAWQHYGFPYHMRSMCLYLVLLALTSYVNYNFSDMVTSSETGRNNARSLVVSVIVITCCFTSVELGQILSAPLRYLSYYTNYIDIISFSFTITGNAMRLYYFADTSKSNALLSIATIALWINLLYYLRPFKSASPVTRMLYVDAQQELRSFVLVMLFFIFGFAQAMYLLSIEDSSSPFARGSGDSYMVAFTYMMGFADFTVFDATTNRSLGLFVIVFYLFVVTIISLNLLIAILSNSYNKIDKDMVIGFRLEKVHVMLDQLHLFREPRVARYIYCLKRVDEILAAEQVQNEVEGVKNAIEALDAKIDLCFRSNLALEETVKDIKALLMAKNRTVPMTVEPV